MIENMISVIIPVYNSEKYLDICLESVLGQRNAEIEILLIDDASSDGSPDICLEYENKYHNVRYFRNEHKGVSEARNAGISFAEGEYLYFLDSDDYLLNDDALYDLWKGMRGADMTIGGYQYLYGNRIVDASAVKDSGIFSTADVIHLSCIGGNKLYRTEIIQEFDILFPALDLGEDLYFFHRYLSVSEKIALVQTPIFVYRMHEGSLSKSYGIKALDYLEAFHRIEWAYRNQPDMRREFLYDEMFYLKNNIKRLPRYPDRKMRILIFDKYQEEAKILPKGKEEAEKMRKWILRAPRFLYCGTLPVLIYRKLRRLKHILLKTEAENAKAQHHAGQTGENYG